MADQHHFVRFLRDGRWRRGLLEEDRVRPVEGSIFGRWRSRGRAIPLASVRLGPPVLPSKIVAVGINYRSHAREMRHDLPPVPRIFLKPASAVIGPGAPIRCPSMSRRVDYEGELGAVIGRRTSRVPLDRALDAVLGYTCCNDVTARDLQKLDGQWTRAKSFDTFAPLGPAVVTGLDPAALRVKSFLNGKRRQDAPVTDLIFDVAALVHFISRVMTLMPGDVIATGTPEGVGPVRPGDEVEVRIDGVGRLRNPVTGDNSGEDDD